MMRIPRRSFDGRFLLLALVASLATAAVARAGELTEAEFLKLHAELQPDDSALWRSVPWKTSVLSAQQIAAEQKKPIFIWAMDGHPLGCTWNNGVIDRESTFADPAVVEFLKTQAVPVAIDQWNQRRQKDSEGEFYRKIASQGPRHDFENGTTQGLYMAAPDGTFLGYTNHRDPERVRQMLASALARFRPADTRQLVAEKIDKRFNLQPPEGGLIVRVCAKVMGGYDEPETQLQQIFQTSLSRDNLWITKAEHEALAAGDFPDRLGLRIAQFHLVDNTRGEPPFWNRREVASAKFAIDRDQITGQVELKSASGDRTYSARLRGQLTQTDGKITQLNMVARGLFSGEGPFTGGAPKGSFPLAISFTLADGTDFADAVPPQAARGWIDGYIR